MHALRLSHSRGALVLALLGAVSLANGCSSSSVDITPPAEIPLEQQVWAPALNVNLGSMTKLSSGVYIRDAVVGTGTLVSGTPTVRVFYAGYLPNGVKFDEVARPSPAASFPLATLIDGFRLGLQAMQVGGQRRIIIPGSLGYGPRGNGVIQGNANLLFDVELIAVN